MLITGRRIARRPVHRQESTTRVDGTMYDASSITILDDEQVCSRFVWAKAGLLATRFERPGAWFQRGLEACDRIGMDHRFLIEKYIERQPVPKHEGLCAALLDILKETR